LLRVDVVMFESDSWVLSGGAFTYNAPGCKKGIHSLLPPPHQHQAVTL
jgi:hypothetical protein